MANKKQKDSEVKWAFKLLGNVMIILLGFGYFLLGGLATIASIFVVDIFTLLVSVGILILGAYAFLKGFMDLAKIGKQKKGEK